MLNGDLPNEFTTTPNLFDKKLTNASPEELSDYSSCGESEFERYCSANSVMGTPSLCSSVGTFNDFLDLDSVSVKIGEDKGVCGTTLGRFDNGGVEFRDDEGRRGVRRLSSSSRVDKWSKSLQNVGEEESSSMSRYRRGGSLIYSKSENGNTRSVGTDDDKNSEVLRQLEVENGSVKDTSEMLGVRVNEEVCDSFDPFGFKENESLEDEETSSRYGLSDDDDDGSMFNSGTDDEERRDVYNKRNLRYSQNSVSNNKDPLVIGSAVAFGSEDWDDFMQANEENNLFSSSFDQLEEQKQKDVETEIMFSSSVSMDPLGAPNIGRIEDVEMLRNSLVKILDNEQEYLESPTTDVLSQKMGLLVEKNALEGSNRKESAEERQYTDIGNEEVVHSNVGDASENHSLGNLDQLVSLSNMTVIQCNSSTSTELSNNSVQLEGQIVDVSQSAIDDDFNTTSAERSEDHLAPIKVGHFESKESYDELVLEMEEILLDSTETPGFRFPQSNKSLKPFRDGSLTASTSGTDDAYPLIQHSIKIDGVEVVGAKQKKGDVSLGERLVGVKEYTVYMLRVWSGNDQWEVERRYRDFFTLYRQLKKLYTNHGWILPKPWSHVEQESRKIFGNASPTIVNGRSALIQDCLRSILHSTTPNSVPGTLSWFLTPEKALSTSSSLNTSIPQSEVPSFGKTVSLLVDIQLRKSVKQLLEAQHYVCAGCHKHLNAEKTLMQTLGWGKPRLCEYTCQLFCTSCHTNETAVLPARVLHFWDFTEYPVSQMAKSYLDSIYDQPMLCVSAVNPHLFSKVPALLHVMDIRKKVGAMMPFVRCPFRRSIQRGVGSRIYLLESNEFFALRDLVDLSKGVFAALPVMMATASKKILHHITHQCLVCCDAGVPCGAKQACEDPSSLIFPFQENEVKRCKSCDSVFHKACFEKILYCPCGAGYKVGRSGPPDLSRQLSNDSNESGLPVTFLSYLFSGKRHAKKLGSRNRNPVILMGSLPSNFDDPM